MKTSAAGIAALEAREGKRMLAYRDSVGVLTIGVGHTGRMAPPAVHLGMTITQAQCDAFLAADLAPVEKAINELGAKLTQNQFDACASLAFNIGVNGFHGSTVARRIAKGDMAGAADAFLLWEKPASLKARREAERRQFLAPDKQPAPTAVAPAAVKHVDLTASNFIVTGKSFVDADKKSPPLSAPASVAAKPAPAPAAAAPAIPPAAPKAATMNPIALFTMAVSLAKDVAPYVPHLVSDVPLFVGDCEKIVADASKLDVNASLADLQKLIGDVKTELPLILTVAKASKALAVA